MTSENKKGKKIINVALPKGRLGEKVYDIFEASGFPCPEIKEDSRKLIQQFVDLHLVEQQ